MAGTLRGPVNLLLKKKGQQASRSRPERRRVIRPRTAENSVFNDDCPALTIFVSGVFRHLNQLSVAFGYASW